MNTRLLLTVHLAGIVYLGIHASLIPWAVSTGKDTLVIAAVGPVAIGAIYFAAMAIVGIIRFLTGRKFP